MLFFFRGSALGRYLTLPGHFSKGTKSKGSHTDLLLFGMLEVWYLVLKKCSIWDKRSLVSLKSRHQLSFFFKKKNWLAASLIIVFAVQRS